MESRYRSRNQKLKNVWDWGDNARLTIRYRFSLTLFRPRVSTMYIASLRRSHNQESAGRRGRGHWVAPQSLQLVLPRQMFQTEFSGNPTPATPELPKCQNGLYADTPCLPAQTSEGCRLPEDEQVRGRSNVF